MGMKEPSADARNRLLLDVTGASPAKAASGRKLQRKRLKKEKTPQGRLFFIFMLEGRKGARRLFPFDGCGRLAGDVVHHAGDTVDLVDDAI